MLKVLSLATSAMAVGQFIDSLHSLDEDLDYQSNILLDEVFGETDPFQSDLPSTQDVDYVLA